MNRLLKKLEAAHNKYGEAKDDVLKYISKHADFETYIVYQPGDGFTLLAVESNLLLAPLDICLKIIDEKGVLTFDEFRKNCI